MNVLCIVDQDHQCGVVAVDHTSKFKVIQLILNPPLMVYNTKNGASLQKLPDKLQISGKRQLVDIIEKKESKTLNTLSKATRVDQKDPSVQSEQAELEQRRKYLYERKLPRTIYLHQPEQNSYSDHYSIQGRYPEQALRIVAFHSV